MEDRNIASDSFETAVTESVAFRLIDDAEKTGELTDHESGYLRMKYKKLYEQVSAAKTQEDTLNKRCKFLQNEILAEKIAVEKLRVEETDETIKLQKAGEIRSALQIELEATEQKDTLAKFELFELKKLHDELKQQLITMKEENSGLVDPVMDKLRTEITELKEQLAVTDEVYERESGQKQILVTTMEELEAQRAEKEAALQQKMDALEFAELEPGRLGRQIGSIENAASGMEQENRIIAKRLKHFNQEQEVQAKHRADSERLRKSILEKLELNRQTLEEREQAVAAVSANLEKAKAQNHDLVTQKVELNVRKREVDNEFRHLNDQMMLANKDYEILKRQLKKKRDVADLVKQNLPGMDNQFKDQEIILKNLQDEKTLRSKEIQKLKDEVDVQVARLLQQEGVETEKKQELEQTIFEMDELESQVVHWLAEGKRQAKLLSVLSAQRDIKGRENARIDSKEKEAKQQVRIKELVILDLTKRCNEISNRLKEFSALYEVVKNERNKYVNLIQSSAQALAEMREKIRILHNEVEILGNERTAKDIALSKERNAHQQAQNQRDGLRQDLNRLLSEYRAKQSTVEQQIQEIDKLNVVINSLEKDMLKLKSKYEHAVEERNNTGVQLIDRNDELCILYERSNQQQEALKKGEIESIKKEEELRMIRLQTEELKRQYQAAVRRLPQLEENRSLIVHLEEQLSLERRRTELLSSKLEDPQNLDRWRPLEGTDPDMEQLTAKIQVLESRLDEKRELVLEKELVLEEVCTLIEKLRSQAVTKRDAAKLLADQLNDLHGCIREVTKKMLASVSELSMYQATALRLQQEKMHREKAYEEASWRFEHGETPSEEALKVLQRTERKRQMLEDMVQTRREEMMMTQPANMLKTAAELRPTAYIPDDLGIPKPYGNLAPFKPTEPGSTMRHIRAPQPKPIEI